MSIYQKIVELLGKDECDPGVLELIKNIGETPAKFREGHFHYLSFPSLGVRFQADTQRAWRLVRVQCEFPRQMEVHELPFGLSSADNQQQVQTKLAVAPTHGCSTESIRTLEFKLPPYHLKIVFDAAGRISKLSIDYTDDLTLEPMSLPVIFEEPYLNFPNAQISKMHDTNKVRTIDVPNRVDARKLTKITAGPGGMYYSCDKCIWFVGLDGQTFEYARLSRIAADDAVSSIKFGPRGVLFVLTKSGVLFSILPDKSGRILTQFVGDHSDNTFSDLIFCSNELIVSTSSPNTVSLWKVDAFGDQVSLDSEVRGSVKSLLLDPTGAIWCLHSDSCSLIRISAAGDVMERITTDDFSACFSDISGDGCLSMDNDKHIYAIAGVNGRLLRMHRNRGYDVILDGLIEPTGLSFCADGTLWLIQKGVPQIVVVNPRV